MSNLILKKEIRRIARESGYTKDKKMLGSVLKVLSMENKDITYDKSFAKKFAKEVLA